MGKKIIALSIVLLAGLIVSCGDDSEKKTSDDSSYTNFKSGYQQLTENTSTALALNSKFYIELQENGSTAYTWKYTADNGFAVFIDESTFSVNGDAIGAPVQRIWRFTSGSLGQTVLTFKKTNVANSSDVIETKVFTVIAQ